MGWFELWNTVSDFLKYIAPAVITFSIFYIALWFLKGYVRFIDALKFIFAEPGRMMFMIVIFIFIWYYWEEISKALGW